MMPQTNDTPVSFLSLSLSQQKSGVFALFGMLMITRSYVKQHQLIQARRMSRLDNVHKQSFLQHQKPAHDKVFLMNEQAFC